jgi:hypothetical protein
MVPGDVNRYILSVGTVHVSFKPTLQTHYGQTIPREIISKKVTKLAYTNNMGNPDFIPEDTNGYGAGLVRITNNTTGVVSGVTVYDKDDLSKFLPVPYGDFTPPYPIQYGKVGRAPVYGTAAVPLREGISQIIQVSLETPNGLLVLERVAALRGQVLDIVIGQSDLNPGGNAQGGRYGSKVTVRNETTTSTNILGMYVYNKANVAASAVYFLDIPSPSPNQKNLYVLSTIGLPVVQGQEYAVRLSVYGNGKIALIDKTFSPDGSLYSTVPDSHLRTITLTQSDLPPELIETFVPVTGITVAPSPYVITSYTESDLDGSNPAITYKGSRNLKNIVTVEPSDATTKGPVIWGPVTGAGASYVSLNPSTGVLEVTGIAPAGSRTVRIGTKIEKAAGSVTGRQDFTGTVEIELAYHNTSVRTKKVENFTLGSGPALKEGTQWDMKSLLTGLIPAGANIDGRPIMADSLQWAIVSPTTSTGSSVSGSTFTAGTPGQVTIKATMPGDKTKTGSSISKTTTITVTAADQPFRAITGMTMNNPSPLQVHFYTKKVGASRTVYDSGELHLSAYAGIAPQNASVQSPIWWSAVSGASGSVTFTAYPVSSPWTHFLRVTSGTAGPANGSTVGVKAKIPGAGPGKTDYVSPEFTVTLVEHYSRPVEPGEIELKDAVIKVNEPLSLNELVTRFPSDAMYDNVKLTAADLEWSIVSGGSYGSLPSAGSVLTGKAAGTVRIRATLPAGKNLGDVRTAEATVTVEALPAASHGSTFTLRIIRTSPVWDWVKQIVLVPVANDTYSETVHRMGYTGDKWATGAGSQAGTAESEFAILYPNNPPNKYYTTRFYTKDGEVTTTTWAENDWVDLVVDWPQGNITGYYMFFIEGDGRVRGYTNPGGLDPKPHGDHNFLFFIRPDYLYENNRLPMGTAGSKNAHLEVDPAATPFLEVIPVSFDDYNNLPSLMLSDGVGKRPKTNYGSISRERT